MAEIVHELYTGVTQSGKTTLARMMAREAGRLKQKNIVYDPLGTNTAGGDWGQHAMVYHDVNQFLDVVYSDELRNAHLWIDEAHNIFAHADKSHMWILTEGRHHGLNSHLITQRPNKVHPDARTNCGRCFMFRLAQDDARAIGNDYGFNDINKINLDKGDFLVLNSGTANFSQANVFNLLEK